MATEQPARRENPAAVGQARSAARQLLVADGVAAAVLGALAALFAVRLAGALALVPVDVVRALGVGIAVYGALLALVAWRWPVRRALLVGVVVVNVLWVLALGLFLGVEGSAMPAAGRWLLTGSAVVAGTFAALEWMVPRRLLP